MPAANWNGVLWENVSTRTAYASSSSEVSLLTGSNDMCVLPALYFSDATGRWGKGIRIEAEGVLSTTGAPTWIYQVRLGTTVGPASLAGTSVGVSPTITAATGVTNQFWRLWLNLICTSPGLGTSNCTLSCAGEVCSGGGFVSPFSYALLPTTPPTATFTTTLDSSLLQCINLSVTCGTNSASNTMTLKHMRVLSRG